MPDITINPFALIIVVSLMALVFPVAPLAICATAGWYAGRRSGIARGPKIGIAAGLGVSVYPITAIWLLLYHITWEIINEELVLAVLTPSYVLTGGIAYFAVRRIMAVGQRNND